MVNYIIENIYFVLQGKPIDENNIIQDVIPQILPNRVCEEQEFTIDPSDISKTLSKKNYERELIIILKSGKHILKPIRFKERFSERAKNWNIKVKIPKFIWTYQEKTKKQLEDYWDEKNRKQINGFYDLEDFFGWYTENVKDKECYYCHLTERESQEIIHYGLLTSNRFPIYGLIDRGINRGYWLEIDRRDPKGLYSRQNCVPSCYFCNNDKSDVFFEKDYIKFKSSRIDLLRKLLKNKPNISIEELDLDIT